jgi:2-keto-4-pentenoate hydratase
MKAGMGMKSDAKKINALAELLFNAELNKKGIDPLTKMESNLTIQDAYQIQLVNVKRKLNEGAKIVGKKIGLTSLAMQKMLGVDQPDYGHLFDSMVVENGTLIDNSSLLQPKVEAEIAFVLKHDLIGPKVTLLDVLHATDYVVASLEIVDSRVQDWKIKLQDTIADNASSGMYVLGAKNIKVDEIDMAVTGMAFYRNGELINTGVGAAALGHPALCVAWLANKLYEFGVTLKAGEVILSGALSAAMDAKPGDEFKANFAHLGEVSVRF